jgi:hypothetical protein
MTFTETLVAALRSLRSNRLRSLLTTLGIIIGVAAVIILVSLGDGVKAGFDAQFSKLANQITITEAKGAVPGGGTARPLTDQDVSALENPRRTRAIASVTPSMTGSVTLTAGPSTEKAQLVGATYNYLDITARSMTVGNWFTQADVQGNEKQVVIGQDAVSYLWGPHTNLGDVLGKQLRLNHTTFKIVGVLDADGQGLSGGQRQSGHPNHYQGDQRDQGERRGGRDQSHSGHPALHQEPDRPRLHHARVPELDPTARSVHHFSHSVHCRCGGDLADRRWHWGGQHHVGLGDRADQRNWHP